MEVGPERLVLASYTSRFGLTAPPSLHMRFESSRRSTGLAREAARRFDFRGVEPDVRFPDGLPVPDWGDEGPVTSASYMASGEELDYDEPSRSPTSRTGLV